MSTMMSLVKPPLFFLPVQHWRLESSSHLDRHWDSLPGVDHSCHWHLDCQEGQQGLVAKGKPLMGAKKGGGV